MDKKRKLNFEVIPDGCWKSNLHEILSKSDWNNIRDNELKRADGACEICGLKTNKLDVHEVWSYDITNLNCGIQKLEKMVCVCKKCHNAIHINRSWVVGIGEQAENHYMKVNSVTYAEMKQDLKEANEINAERNKVVEWMLDISCLENIIKV